ncbi:hypothetical protein RND71_039933 [Anisodus tanguticus]|uniref:CRAL/TRIO N-terminal domain-containing protein n=1 Tax=Anisodus tanguticus TaxID=243964 RepID=A0AAE1R0I2_9SOLA|nr:hypothetical protein RND71_039933 [Anisodus tanguticus]
MALANDLPRLQSSKWLRAPAGIKFPETMSTGPTKSTSNGFENSLRPEEEQNKIDEMRKLIGLLSGKLAIYCSDVSISRYLAARSWNVKKAAKMLKATLKWRLDYKPEEIRWSESATLKPDSAVLILLIISAKSNLCTQMTPTAKKMMEELFEISLMESAFGGDDKADFDVNKYAERMREDDKKFSFFWKIDDNSASSAQPTVTADLSLEPTNSDS